MSGVLKFLFNLNKSLLPNWLIEGRVEFLHEKGRERTLSFDEERKYLRAAAPVLRDVANDHGRDGAAAR